MTADVMRLLEKRAANVEKFIAQARESGDCIEAAQWEGAALELRFLRLELTHPTRRADDAWNVVCTAEPTA